MKVRLILLAALVLAGAASLYLSTSAGAQQVGESDTLTATLGKAEKLARYCWSESDDPNLRNLPAALKGSSYLRK